MKSINVSGVSQIQKPDLTNWEKDLAETKQKQKQQNIKEFKKFLKYYEKYMDFTQFVNSPEGKTFKDYIFNTSALYKYVGLVDIDVIWKYREFDRKTETHKFPEDVESLKESIKEKGIYDPVIFGYDKTGNILLIEGNHRIYMGKDIEMKYIPVRINRSVGIQSQDLPQYNINLPITTLNEWDLPRGWYYFKADMQPQEIGLPQIDKELLLQWWLGMENKNPTVSGVGMNLESLYFEAVSNYYNDPELEDLIKQGEEMALQMCGSDNIETEISDSGNLIIRYFIHETNIYLLGVVTLKGRLTREDLFDYRNWVNILLEKLEDGYVLYSSPNDLSMPLLNKIIETAKEQGLKINRQEFGEFTFKDVVWKNVKVNVVSGVNNLDIKIDRYKLENNVLDYYWNLSELYFNQITEEDNMDIFLPQDIILLDLIFHQEDDKIIMIALAEKEDYLLTLIYDNETKMTYLLIEEIIIDVNTETKEGIDNSKKYIVDLGQFDLEIDNEDKIKEFLTQTIIKGLRTHERISQTD